MANNFLITIGGLAILFGAFDIFDAEKRKDLGPILIKIIGGGGVIGIGFLLHYYKIDIGF